MLLCCTAQLTSLARHADDLGFAVRARDRPYRAPRRRRRPGLRCASPLPHFTQPFRFCTRYPNRYRKISIRKRCNASAAVRVLVRGVQSCVLPYRALATPLIPEPSVRLPRTSVHTQPCMFVYQDGIRTLEPGKMVPGKTVCGRGPAPYTDYPVHRIEYRVGSAIPC